MNLIATLRLRWRSRGAFALGVLALGLMNVLLQSCVLAAGVTDTAPASIAHGGNQTGPAWQVANDSQMPCLRCGVHDGPRCEDTMGEDCATADRASANSPIKPTDRSPDLATMPPPTLAATDSFSRLPAACRPLPSLTSPQGPSLNIWYCVYLI
jgi:hypothetical protein